MVMTPIDVDKGFMLYVVVLDPEPGDSQRQDTNKEDNHDKPEDMFEPAG